MFHVSPAPDAMFVRVVPLTPQLGGCPTFIRSALPTSSVLIYSVTRYTGRKCVMCLGYPKRPEQDIQYQYLVLIQTAPSPSPGRVK